MNKELHKRIEEAAEQALQLLGDTCYIHIDETTECAYKDGYKDGAEHGYKEAIAIAKKWIKNEIGNYSEIDYLNTDPVIDIRVSRAAKDFEAYMNILLEEKK